MKNTTPAHKNSGGAKKSKTKEESATQRAVNFVRKNLGEVDKAQLASYIAIALLVVYGIRKSNIMGGITLSVVSGMLTKLFAEEMTQLQPAVKKIAAH